MAEAATEGAAAGEDGPWVTVGGGKGKPAAAPSAAVEEGPRETVGGRKAKKAKVCAGKDEEILAAAPAPAAGAVREPKGWDCDLPSSYSYPGKPAPDHLNWKSALRKFLAPTLDQETQRRVYVQDDTCVVIYDCYPKASRHVLLMPRPGYLNRKGPGDLRSKDLPLLRTLHRKGREVADNLKKGWEKDHGKECMVRIGYHGIPSLEPLHLHIISQDFEASECVKNKKHINTFTTSFFLEAERVERELEQQASSSGRLQLSHDGLMALEKQALRCFKCKAPQKNLPSLKTHMARCKAPIPLSLEG